MSDERRPQLAGRLRRVLGVGRRARGRRPRTATGLVLAAAPLLALPALAAGTAGAEPAATSRLYLVQGVTGSTWSIRVDGQEVAAAAGAKEVLGPVEVAAGSHEVLAVADDGTRVTAAVEVTDGQSVDAVLHRQVDPAAEPVITAFPNDLSPIAPGEGRLTVAHTAAVGPADIEVDGRVLFANVASGEELSVAVPGDTYSVQVVPASSRGPAVLGPVDLPVEDGSLTRVFAIGVAADESMDAVVQVLPLPVRGRDQDAPSSVPGGDGGQAATSFLAFRRSTGG